MSESDTYSQDTVAIIVSYHPDTDTVREALQSLESQCATVIVDNGSGADTLSRLKEVADDELAEFRARRAAEKEAEASDGDELTGRVVTFCVGRHQVRFHNFFQQSRTPRLINQDQCTEQARIDPAAIFFIPGRKFRADEILA